MSTPETLCWIRHSVDVPHVVIQGTLRALWHDVLPHTAARPTIWLAAMAIHNTLRSSAASAAGTSPAPPPMSPPPSSSLAASAVALLWACVVLSSSLISVEAHHAVISHAAAPRRVHTFVATLLAQYRGAVPRPPHWAAAALAELPTAACVNALCVATYFPEHFHAVDARAAVAALCAHAADFDAADATGAVGDAAVVAALQRALAITALPTRAA
jgi:hypothetical protein